jgi:diguanylate cyclase (GGDEF)-like protein
MLAGGALAGISVALPPAATKSETAVIALGALALVVGTALLLTKRTPREWVLGAGIGLGTVLITTATWAGGPETGTGANEILYIWVCIYAFYFLSLRHALGQLAFVAVAYGWILSERNLPLEVAANEWIITLSTLLVAGLLIARLSTSLRGVVSELDQRARHDGLTGLLNRQEFEERGVLELARQRRESSELALVAIDLDDFKALNDSLGHPAGDRVLRRMARMLDSETRRNDAVARVGGDEFLVLLPATGEKDARGIAERLLQAARESKKRGNEGYSVSIGVAIAGPESATLLGLWAAADEALYAAKRSGGDRVAVARVARPRATDTVAVH